MRFALSLSPTIGPPSSLSPLAHPTSVPCRRKFTHLIRVPHQNRTAPLSPSLTPAALEASVVTILSTSVASLLPLFFSLHIQRNDGDPNSLAELLSASAEERAILDSIDVAPVSAAGSIPSPSAASSAPLQAKVCPESDLSFHPPSSALSGRMIFFQKSIRLWNSNTHRGAFPSRSPAAGEENSSIPFGTSQVDFGSYPKISRSTFPPQTQPNLQPPLALTDGTAGRGEGATATDRREPEAERARFESEREREREDG